jgi:hypothetical protein
MSDWTGEPSKVLVAGDVHGSVPCTLGVIHQASRLPPPRYLLQLGDFGFRVPSAGLTTVAYTARRAGVTIWVVEGNHDDHPGLAAAAARHGPSEGPVPLDTAGPVFHLRRGQRWQWHGRTWLAAGGAVSPDRAARTAGVDWWPEEELTDTQAEAIAAGGPVDVLACHDRPAGVPYTYPPAPDWWDDADLARSAVHCERLQRLIDQVQPSHVMHGHLHDVYERTVDTGYGPLRVTCLDCNGRPGSWRVLDVRSMEWEPRVGRRGLGPRTNGLKVRDSAIELAAPGMGGCRRPRPPGVALTTRPPAVGKRGIEPLSVVLSERCSNLLSCLPLLTLNPVPLTDCPLRRLRART